MAASRRLARPLTALLGIALLAGAIILMVRPEPRYDVQGHRGARGALPENTMPAFTFADDLGVTTLEMDTKVTRDGVLVVTHDSILNPDLVRDKSGNWVREGIPVNSLTLDQVKRLDVGRLRPGSAYAQRFPEQRPIDGTRIPTLREVLDGFRDRSAVRFNIETKIEPDHPELSPDPAAFSRALVDELLRLGDHGGSVPALVAAAGADIWSPDFETLTAESVGDAHERGLRVVPWTVNEPVDLDAVRALGVDGVISDYPKRALDAAPRGVPRWVPGGLLAAGATMIIAAALSKRRQG